MRKMDVKNFTTKILENWPIKNVEFETVLEIVKIAEERKTFGYKFEDEIESKFGVSNGFAHHVANEMKMYRKVNYGTKRSPEEARADRVLRIRDSTGKATARKFN